MNAPRGAKDRQSTSKLPASNNSLNSSNKSPPSQVSITVSSSSPPTFEVEKSNETFNPKIQPTAEQMRIAQIINDGSKNDDPDIQNKIEQVMELTKKSRDEVQIALHDCDNDPERAALLLLEGIQDHEGKWELSVKKKKNRQQQPANLSRPSEETNGVDGSNNKDESTKADSNPGRKGRGGAPRMNRNWRNKENEKNERNVEEGRSRGGGNGDKESRSRGRKSGRGSRSRGETTGNRASAGGATSGGRSRTFQNKTLNNEHGASTNFPPSIEMWSNSAASVDQPSPHQQPSTTMNVGNWSDFTASEDWGEDDWSGNLETTVYTPSSSSATTATPHTDSMVPAPPASLQDATPAASSSHYNGGMSYPSYSAPATDLQCDTRPKVVQRVRVPPPSKVSGAPHLPLPVSPAAVQIPETAVEMPGDAVGGLEIQFGGLQFTGSLDFTATSSVAEVAAPSFSVSSSLPSSSIPIANSLSSSFNTPGLGASPSSLYPAVTSSSTLPPPPSSILNKDQALLLSSSSSNTQGTTFPSAAAANVPRPMAISSHDGTTKSTSDLSSFYSPTPSNSGGGGQKVLPAVGSGAYSSGGGSPLYPAASSSAAAVSNNYQPSSTSGAGYGSGYGSSEYTAYSSAASQSTSSKLPPDQQQQQQAMGPSLSQGTYGGSTTASGAEAALGHQSSQQLSTSATSVLKSSSLPAAATAQQPSGAGKGYNPLPPTLVPPQYIMGQAPPPPSLPFYQQPVCNYEDIQSRLATLGYYDVPVAAAPGRGDSLQYTTCAAAVSGGSVSSSVAEASKYPAPPPSRGSNTGDGDQPPASSSQQTFPIPPGYGYYIHGGMMAAAAATTPHYPTPFFSVHQPSNAHGGAVSTTNQFQKPTAFGSHSFNSVSYDSLNAQSQDFLKGSFASSTNQGKNVAGSELTAGAMYNKGNAMLAKTFDKAAAAAGFQSNPHQYGMATGNQTSFSFIPVLPQHHSLMHLRQDGSTAAVPQSSAAAVSQQKAKSQGYATAAATTYWNT